MQECYQIVFPGQAPITKKGHIEPIDISVASRGSNKKVRTFATNYFAAAIDQRQKYFFKIIHTNTDV